MVVDEVRLARRDRAKKNQGGGRGKLPLRRKYERAQIEQRTRGGKPMGNMDTRTPEEMAELGLTVKLTNDGAWMEYVGEEEAKRALALRQKLTADLPKMEAFIAECDETIALVGGQSTMFLSQIEDRAEELVKERNIDYGEAMRLSLSDANAAPPSSGTAGSGGMKLVASSDYGTDYPTRRDEETDAGITVESIQATATEKGIGFAEAVRQSDAQPERDLPWAGGMRPLPERTEAEQKELREAARRAGYGDLDDPNDGHSGSARFV
jgi:hypothetical protein